MVCPSCTHRELSASFAASAVKTQALVPRGKTTPEWRTQGLVYLRLPSKRTERRYTLVHCGCIAMSIRLVIRKIIADSITLELHGLVSPLHDALVPWRTESSQGSVCKRMSRSQVSMAAVGRISDG